MARPRAASAGLLSLTLSTLPATLMSAPIEALQKAVSGDEADFRVLEPLCYDAEKFLAIRDEAIPLVVRLAKERPETAQHLPKKVITHLLQGLSLKELIQKKALRASYLEVPALRAPVLSIVLDKAQDSEFTEIEVLVRESFRLLVIVDLDTESLALIERLIRKMPDAAQTFVPFKMLFEGSAELQTRLISVSTSLLALKRLPPINTLVWLKPVSEDEDLLLSALQIDYIADLAKFLVQFPEIELKITPALYEICHRYGDSLLNSAIERALAKLAHVAEPLFLELDAQFLLVKPERPDLIAQVPYEYITRRHPEVIDQLELKAANLHAIANISQSYLGLRLLRLSASKILKLPRLQQLFLAAAATNSPEGAELFRDQYLTVLQNAVDTPNSDETRELKIILQTNLKRSNIRLRKQPVVQVV